jgi:hypothetical protein
VQTQPDLACPNCGIWEPQTDDAFCGWCGGPVGKLLIGVDPSPVFRAREVAQTTHLLIQNPTCGGVDVTGFDTSSDWAKIDPVPPFTISPGQVARQRISIDTLSVASDFSEAWIDVVNSLDVNARIRLSALGAAVKPKLEPDTLLLWKSGLSLMSEN